MIIFETDKIKKEFIGVILKDKITGLNYKLFVNLEDKMTLIDSNEEGVLEIPFDEFDESNLLIKRYCLYLENKILKLAEAEL